MDLVCRCTLFAVFAIGPSVGYAEPAKTEVVVSSPSKKCNVALKIVPDDQRTTRLEYRVEYRQRTVLSESRLGISIRGHGDLGVNSVVESVENQSAKKSYQQALGKNNPAVDHYNESRVRFNATSGIVWELVIRAYDDGIAFRYRIPKQPGVQDIVFQNEKTEFNLTQQPLAHFLTAASFTTGHEGPYRSDSLENLPANELIDVPALFVRRDGTAVAITEARLRNFGGMYLSKEEESSTKLRAKVSPIPGRPNIAAISRDSLETPWRVVMLADRAGELLESDLIVNLNDSPSFDTTWIVPGKSTWHWWNGTRQQGLSFVPGMNLITHQYYIDFCAEHNIAYHAVVADERPWYLQSRNGYAPGADTNILSPRPELQLPKILKYARSKGVGIRLWVHWKPLSKKLDEAFALYESWGIKGLMVDFMDRDDQEMVEFCERVLETAAKHHLHIQFHGVYKPTGLRRTYPNLFNKEGVLNLEYLKWSDRCTTKHNVTVPYTRMLAGPMDYHAGGFRSVSKENFQARNLAPFVLGTRCHHLAMYVVYENPMPMVCDFPIAYEDQPGFEFIEKVPTVWDETRFIAGEPGDFIVLARRKGDTWYVGAMTDKHREIHVPMRFLADGEYHLERWSDDMQQHDDLNRLTRSERNITSNETLTLVLATGGGCVLQITPVSQSGTPQR